MNELQKAMQGSDVMLSEFLEVVPTEDFRAYLNEITLTPQESEVVRALIDLYHQNTKVHGYHYKCETCRALDAAGNLQASDHASLAEKVGWKPKTRTT